MPRRRLTTTAARAAIDAAELVKAPDWSETRDWHVVTTGGEVLVVVTPAYRAGVRRGWTYHLHALGPTGGHQNPHPTREKAAAAGLAAWQRWATATR